MYQANAISYFQQNPRSVASISHTIIGVIAVMDFATSMCLIAGVTHKGLYILRVIPFCLTVLLYSLIAQQWIHVARGSLNEHASGTNVIATINLTVICATVFL